MEQLLQFLHPKTVISSPSFYSDKMRWEWGWSKQLYVLFVVKIWSFTESDFSEDITYSLKVKYIKIYQDIMIKTSRLHHWVKIGDFVVRFENVEISFGNRHPESILKILEVFKRNISAGVLFKPLSLRLTVISLMFLKLMILWYFIMIYEDLLLILLILVSSQPYLNFK